MRAHVFFMILTMFSSAALAQQPAAQGAAPAAKLFAGSADVTALMAKAKSERKPDQPNFIQPIVSSRLTPRTSSIAWVVSRRPRRCTNARRRCSTSSKARERS